MQIMAEKEQRFPVERKSEEIVSEGYISANKGINLQVRIHLIRRDLSFVLNVHNISFGILGTNHIPKFQF